MRLLEVGQVCRLSSDSRELWVVESVGTNAVVRSLTRHARRFETRYGDAVEFKARGRHLVISSRATVLHESPQLEAEEKC